MASSAAFWTLPHLLQPFLLWRPASRPEDDNEPHVDARQGRERGQGPLRPAMLQDQGADRGREGLSQQARQREATYQDRVADRPEQGEGQGSAPDRIYAIARTVEHQGEGKQREPEREKREA